MPEWLDATVIVALIALIGNQIVESRRSAASRKAEEMKENASAAIIMDAAETVGLSGDAVNLQAKVLAFVGKELVIVRAELVETREAYALVKRDRDRMAARVTAQDEEILVLQKQVAALEDALEAARGAAGK